MISIIVPVYNSEKQLRRCIKSLLNQTYNDIEIILIDDGSTDSSGTICDEFATYDSRVKVIHKENGGVSAARNTGIENALGEYIMFRDSDDFVDENYCLSHIECKQKHPDYMPMSGYAEVSDAEKEIRYVKLQNWSPEADGVILLDIEGLLALNDSHLINTVCCKLYDAYILDENNIRFKIGVSMGEDLMFNLTYLQYSSCKNAYIDDVFYYYCDTNADSLSKKTGLSNYSTYSQIFTEWEKLFNPNNVSQTTLSKMYAYHFNDILSGLHPFSVNKNISKRTRIKTCKRNIYMKEFKKSRDNMDINYANDKKLYKISKPRFILLLFFIVKVLR